MNFALLINRKIELTMKNINRYWILMLLLFFTNELIFAQSAPEVVIEKLDVSGYNAQFTEDGEQLVYTSENYRGVQLYDLKSKRLEEITKAPRSGYDVHLEKDQIIYKMDVKSEEFACFNLKSRKTIPYDLSSNKQKNASSSRVLAESEDDLVINAVPSSDLRAIELTFLSGLSKTIVPLGDQDYINVGISPNGKKLVFRVSGVGSYVTNSEGNILRDLGNVEFPMWAGNDQILCTETKDDGYNYLSSEVFLQSVNEDIKWNLTTDTNAIALYPNINKAQDKVIFNTPKGDLYILKLL